MKKSAVLIFLATLSNVFSHGGDSHGGGGKRAVRGASAGAVRSLVLERDTSSRFVMDFYGFSSLGWGPDLRGIDPLGTGGRSSLYYNSTLYQENPIDFSFSGGLQKRKLRVESGDFGYIPTWQPGQAFFGFQYRFLPRLWSVADVIYGGELNQEAGQVEPGQFSLGSLKLIWMPETAPGLTVTAGTLENSSGFSELFGVSPLESFSLTGLQFTYARDCGPIGSCRFEGTGGTIFSGFTVRHNGYYDPTHEGYYETQRQRTHVYASILAEPADVFRIRWVGGFQVLPGDSSTFRDLQQIVRRQEFEPAAGWHAGLETGYQGRTFDHTLILAHGSGDVLMASGSPAYVLHDRAPSAADLAYFSRKGSRLTHAVYWGSAERDIFRLEAGAWGMFGDPARNPRPQYDLNNWVYDNPDIQLDPDSALIKDGLIISDSLTLGAEPFRAVKFAVKPSVLLWKRLRLGFRYDRILFLDPGAHANTQEMRTDPLLGNVLHRRVPDFPLRGPSRWELEPVDAHIMAPSAALELGESVHCDFTWSVGIYDRPVRRHGETGTWHRNFSASAALYYRVKL